MKNRRELLKPKLSKIDKFIYEILFLLTIFFPIVFAFLFLFLRKEWIFCNAEVLAVYNSELCDVLYFSPLFIAFFIFFILVFIAFYLKRPLLRSDRKKSGDISLLITKKRIFISILLIFMCIYITTFNFFPRTELTDSSINVYNSFNQLKKSVSLKNIQFAEIYLRYNPISRGLGRDVLICEISVSESSSYIFELSNFRNIYALQVIDNIFSEQGIPINIRLPSSQKCKELLKLNDQEVNIIESIIKRE